MWISFPVINGHRVRHTGEDCLESGFDIRGVQRRCLDKGQTILSYMQLVSYRIQERESMPTGKRLGLICGYCTQVFQIALVAHKHDDDIRISVVPQFLQPPCHVNIGCVLGDIIDQKGANSTTVVTTGTESDGEILILGSVRTQK